MASSQCPHHWQVATLPFAAPSDKVSVLASTFCPPSPPSPGRLIAAGLNCSSLPQAVPIFRPTLPSLPSQDATVLAIQIPSYVM